MVLSPCRGRGSPSKLTATRISQRTGWSATKGRTPHLRRFGIGVLRFTNHEIFENLDSVLARIEEVLQRRRDPRKSRDWSFSRRRDSRWQALLKGPQLNGRWATAVAITVAQI